MTAANSLRQEDIMQAANSARQAVTDLDRICRAGTNSTENPEVRGKIMNTARKTTKAFLDLLVCLQTVSL